MSQFPPRLTNLSPIKLDGTFGQIRMQTCWQTFWPFSLPMRSSGFKEEGGNVKCFDQDIKETFWRSNRAMFVCGQSGSIFLIIWQTQTLGSLFLRTKLSCRRFIKVCLSTLWSDIFLVHRNNEFPFHLFLRRDGNPVPRTVQMKFLQLIRLVHNESSLI